jgi:hypothetical protein
MAADDLIAGRDYDAGCCDVCGYTGPAIGHNHPEEFPTLGNDDLDQLIDDYYTNGGLTWAETQHETETK